MVCAYRQLLRSGARRVLPACILALGLPWFVSIEANEPRFEAVGPDAGLSHNSVFALTQDHQGFLWLGTADGLNRFDGRGCRVWRHDEFDSTSISSSHVQFILEDRGKKLWVGTGRGLDHFNRTTGAFVHMNIGVPHASVSHLFEDASGALWVGLMSGEVLTRVDDDHFRIIAARTAGDPSVTNGEVIGIHQDTGGMIWALTSTWGAGPTVFHRINPKTGNVRRYPAPNGWGRCSGFVIDTSGRFWLNLAGVGSFDPETGRFGGPLFDLDHPILGKPTLDSKDRVWLPVQGGVHLFDPATGTRTMHRLSSSNGFLAELSGPVFEDRSGAVWVGTRGGLAKWDPAANAFSHWRSREEETSSLGGSQVSSVAQDRSGALWVGTYGGGLARLIDSDGRFTRYRNQPGDPESLCHDIIWDMEEDRDGSLWLGVENGLCRFASDRSRFELVSDRELNLPTDPGHTERITAVVEDEYGMLWLGSTFGVLRFDPTTLASVRHGLAPDDNPRVDVNKILLVGTTLWVGTGSGRPGLFRIDTTTETSLTHEPVLQGPILQGDGVFDIHLGSQGELWLATSSGLVRYDPIDGAVNALTTRDGLPGSLVYSILEDDTERLWLGTNNGISRYDPALDGTSQFRNFGPDDGIGNLEFNRHAAHATSDGRFFFGGMNGLTSFQPAKIHDNAFVPPLAFTEVSVWGPEGVTNLEPYGLDRVDLSHNRNTISFRFAALNFTGSSRNRFTYFLEGHDEDWVDGGIHDVARYTELPPGSYVFHVKGSNNDGVWNTRGISLPVHVAPSFWKSWWGRGLLALLGIATLVAFHRYRVSRLLEVERLRWRIADDLHDDLSSDVSGIALAANLVRRDHKDERLDDIEEVSQGVVERLRDVVWYVNPEHDSPRALLRRMRDAAGRLLPDTRYTIDADLPRRDLILDMATRRHLFMIFKEALHNVARHAHATIVEIQLIQDDGRLALVIRDDGIGFDLAKDERGLGLTSMQRRAHSMGADLRVSSHPGQGTEIELNMARTRGGWQRLRILRWLRTRMRGK